MAAAERNDTEDTSWRSLAHLLAPVTMAGRRCQTIVVSSNFKVTVAFTAANRVFTLHLLANSGIQEFLQRAIDSAMSDSLDDVKLPLPTFLQMLTSHNVPASKAMAVTGKM